jgi:hypothetical protein
MSSREIIYGIIILLILLIPHVPKLIERIGTITLKIRSRFSKRKIKEKISLLVPYTGDEATREVNWDALKQYWEINLPEAELIIEGDDSVPFCKTAAVNRAFRKSTGDVVVILDADCFMDPEVIRECADNIRVARCEGYPLWYVPYRSFYRLTEETTTILRFLICLNSTYYQCVSEWLGDPPTDNMYQHHNSNSSAHWFGALVQIMPREAFELVDGMDERFIGWGGEDISFMNAVDTLYGRHRTHPGPVYHMWHKSISNGWGTRLWKGQQKHNGTLTARYEAARGDRRKMARLIGRN